MIIESIISFCRWIAGAMWRRGIGTASIVVSSDSNLPTLPTLATNRDYTNSSPVNEEYFFDEMLFDEIIISE